MNEALVFVIVLPTLFITIGYVLTTIARSISRARRDRCNMEVQLRLLDRLGNGPDVLSFMQSDAGRKFVAAETDLPASHVSRILNAAQSGAVMVCTGIGMCLVSPIAQEAGAFLRVAGGILIAAGAGLAASALWSQWLLKRWGLLTANQPPQQ